MKAGDKAYLLTGVAPFFEHVVIIATDYNVISRFNSDIVYRILYERSNKSRSLAREKYIVTTKTQVNIHIKHQLKCLKIQYDANVKRTKDAFCDFNGYPHLRRKIK